MEFLINSLAKGINDTRIIISMTECKIYTEEIKVQETKGSLR